MSAPMYRSSPIKRTVRVLMECLPTDNGGRPLPEGVGKGGCGKVWLEVEKVYGVPDHWGRRTETIKTPHRCPNCNGWSFRMRAELKVTKGGTHSCRDTCQESESRSCRCSCGGKMHGAALRLRAVDL